MLCSQARTRLEAAGWLTAAINRDSELLEHLGHCVECSSLVRAEQLLNQSLRAVRNVEPASPLPISVVRARVESTSNNEAQPKPLSRIIEYLIPNSRSRIAVAVIMALFAIVALIPLDFNQKVGYQIAIDGVGREIALENPKITSLLGALGMEQEVATSLLDSLGMNQIHFTVGECSETCRLTILDLRTERDVRLMVKAIIDLGCCRIDNVAPVFRNESVSLLGLATRKLLS